MCSGSWVRLALSSYRKPSQSSAAAWAAGQQQNVGADDNFAVTMHMVTTITVTVVGFWLWPESVQPQRLQQDPGL